MILSLRIYAAVDDMEGDQDRRRGLNRGVSLEILLGSGCSMIQTVKGRKPVR